MSTLERIGALEVEFEDDPANHEFDCDCFLCIPGAM